MGFSILPKTRKQRIRLGILVAILGSLPATIAFFVAMPGESYAGPLAPLSATQRDAAQRMRQDVETLAGPFAERHMERPAALQGAADHIVDRWKSMGLEPVSSCYLVGGAEVCNLIVELPGLEPDAGIVIVGAHYDSAWGLPGADDNASGVAMMLELSERFAAAPPSSARLRFIAFVNEEPPHFQRDSMGSLFEARKSKAAGEEVSAMLSLETLGMYSDKARTQNYPFPFSAFFGDRGNFVGFVGGVASRTLVRGALHQFRTTTDFPSEGVTAPLATPGIGWSDHWSYAQMGYPALMITDTALHRNSNYHTENDLPETLDFESMARVCGGVEEVVVWLLKN